MKKILFLVTTLFLLFTAACTMERGGGEKLPSGKTLRLNVAIDELLFDGGGDQTRSGASTRATIDSEEGEDQVGSLYLLFFEADAAGQGTFVDWVEVDLGEEFDDMNLQTRITDLDISATAIDPSEAYNILAIANISDTRYLGEVNVANWMDNFTNMTEEQVVFNTRAYVTAMQKIDHNGLLMNGRTEKAAGQTQLNLTLSRNKARLDVVNNAREAYDLVSATIWNAYPSSSIWSGEVMMDYSSAAARIHNHYGLDNSSNESQTDGVDGRGKLLNDIHGGLYVFENQVVAPQSNDNLTTCLIVGMVKRGETTPTYYRANIVLDGNSQYIRRNHAYTLTIRSISGPGAPTEKQAYIGQGNTIEYTIGWWNIDDNGLIVKDDYSILSLPTKVVNIGRESSTSNFSIHTFSSQTSPAPLAIRSQTYSPTGDRIRAYLDGNTLVIDADALDYNESERRGVIVLSYAGLETSITVIQSGDADDYLRVFMPEGGIPQFLAFGGIPSGLIRVEATGPWTARLYMDGFSFSSVPSATPVKTLASSSGLVVENRFRVYTNSINETGRVRDAFIVVSLDKDPENYQALVRISQAAAGAIKLMPDDQTTVTFNGAGELATILGMSNTNEFKVYPGLTGGTINVWTANMVSEGTYTDSGHFTVTYNHDPVDAQSNTVTVTAKGINTYGRTLSAILRIQTDPATYSDIIVYQQPANITLVPTTVSAVSVKGGQTVPIRIEGPESITWSAVIKPVASSSSDGRSLVKHTAWLVDQDGNELATDGTTYPITKQFRVVFPKVYYPNRNIPIAVDVEVTVAGVKQAMRVTQNTLTSKGFTGINLTGGYYTWGMLGETYNRGWDSGLSRIPGYSRITTDATYSTSSINASATYLHVVPQSLNTNGEAWNWASVHDFIANDRGWVVISHQADVFGATNNISSPFKRGGYNDLVYGGGSTGAYIHTDHTSTKLYQFVMEKGMTSISASQVSEFYSDTYRTSIPGPWPSSAVVLLSRDGSTNNAMLIVDIENGFMYIGESQFFWADEVAYTSGNRGTFMDNLLLFIGNASMYGTHFTDLLLEDGRPGAQPAPWDDHWGSNRASTANGVPRW